MDTKIVIMVQIADRMWTLEALHHACLLARRMPAKIALVKMIPDQYYSCAGYLSHPPGFLVVKQAEVVTIMGYHAALSQSPSNSGQHDLRHLRLEIFSFSVSTTH